MKHSLSTLSGLGLESEGGNVDLFDTPETVTEDTIPAESLETDLLEVQDETSEVETVVDTVDEAGDAIDMVNEAVEIATESLKHGGMDTTSSRLFNLAVVRAANKVGLSAESLTSGRVPGIYLPSTESFESPSNRVASTESAIETAKNFGKKVWDKIVAIVMSSYQWLKDKFKTMFSSVDKIKERAEAIKKEAAEFKGDLKGTKLPAKLANFIMVEGDQTLLNKSASDVLEAVEGFTKLSTMFDIGALEAALKADDLKASLKEFDEKLYKSVDTAIPPIKGNNAVAVVKRIVGNSGDDFHTFGYSLPGNRVIYLGISLKDGNSKIKVGSADIPFKADKGKTEEVGIPNLSLSDIQATCDNIIKACDKTKTFLDATSKMNEKKKSIIDAVKAKQKDAEKKDEDLNTTRESVVLCMNLIDKMFAEVNKYVMLECKGLLDICQRSLKGGAAEEKKEESKEEKKEEDK